MNWVSYFIISLCYRIDCCDIRMPAGVPTRSYVKAVAAAILCTFAGSQTVHLIYKPLDVSIIN